MLHVAQQTLGIHVCAEALHDLIPTSLQLCKLHAGFKIIYGWTDFWLSNVSHLVSLNINTAMRQPIIVQQQYFLHTVPTALPCALAQ